MSPFAKLAFLSRSAYAFPLAEWFKMCVMGRSRWWPRVYIYIPQRYNVWLTLSFSFGQSRDSIRDVAQGLIEVVRRVVPAKSCPAIFMFSWLSRQCFVSCVLHLFQKQIAEVSHAHPLFSAYPIFVLFRFAGSIFFF